jgi:hypothetical protein
MATRSRIGIVNEDGTVSSIYCHWDGYVSHHGPLLLTHYTDREKVKALIELGSISVLAQHVEPPSVVDENDIDGKKGERMLKRFGVIGKHSFYDPLPGVTVAYHRDRGEEYIKPRINKSLEDYFLADNEEYGYVFTLEGEWLVKSGYNESAPIRPIAEVLAEET